MPVPCNSSRSGDTRHEACQSFCKLAQHCSYCKCRKCTFCQPPEQLRTSPFLQSSAYGAAVPLHPAELGWKGDERACYGRNRPQRFAGPFQATADASHPKLLVAGPVDDGFWVRGLHVFALYGWSRQQSPPVPIHVASNASTDPYYDAATMGPNSWSFYFEPIDQAPAVATFELPCTRVYELMLKQRYATTFHDVVRQRAERSRIWRELAIRPRPRFADEADRFWRDHFGSSGAPVLGVHFRGVDKRTKDNLPDRYVALTRMYLAQHPDARVFLATDSANFSAAFTETLRALGVPFASRAALRSNSATPMFSDSWKAPPLQLGTDVLLDTLLLSRCSFLIKGVSMVSEFAIYMNMRLNHSSFDTVLRGQPATLGAPEEAEQHAGAPTEPPPPLSDAPRISYILQYFRHPHALAEIVRRLQHPRLEVVVHADSNTTADAAAFAAVRSQFPRTRLVHSANLHELRGYNKAALRARGELLAFAQDDSLPPPTTAWVDALVGVFAAVPELATVGLHRGGTSWLKGSEDALTLGGWWCNASAASRVQPPPAWPLVFASWLSLDPIVVRRAAFRALGGFDERFSEPGAPAMGMEKDLVARLWLSGWSSAVLCPSKNAVFSKSCGAKGTATDGGAARDDAARTNRELLHRLHNKSVGHAIEAQVTLT